MASEEGEEEEELAAAAAAMAAVGVWDRVSGRNLVDKILFLRFVFAFFLVSKEHF